jgi:hypothetical protein
MKRLYEVTALWYVIAESEDEATAIIPAFFGIIVNCELAEDIKDNWDDLIPFGTQDNNEEKKCLELLSEQNEIRQR